MAKTFLPPDLDRYVQAHSVQETAILRRLREETLNTSNPEMQITADQGKFLALLVGLIGAVNTIEIGVFTGYSSLCVAQALPQNGKIVACDVHKEWTSVAQRYWKLAGVANKIELRISPAVETLRSLVHEGKESFFDFIFIDADKENLDVYYELSLTLVRKRGLIAVDNTLRNGEVLNTSSGDLRVIATKALNEKLMNDQRAEISLLPAWDGLTLVMKK
jgi:predicted O-methyltransferase YrrM